MNEDDTPFSSTESEHQEEPDSSSQSLPSELRKRIPRMSARYFAATMDNGFLVFTFLLAGGVLGESIGRVDNEFIAIAIGIGLFAISFFYFFLTEWLLGTTPGKYWMGLKVVKTDGSPCTFKPALIRTLWRVVEANPFTWLPAGLIIYFTPTGRRIGDYHANTVVVESRR